MATRTAQMFYLPFSGAILSLSLSPPSRLLVAIVFGNAHIFYTYFYLFKSRKLSLVRLIGSLFISVVLLLASFTLISHKWLAISVGSLFGWHLWADEMKLSKEPKTWPQIFNGLGLACLLGLSLYKQYFGFEWASATALGLGSVFFTSNFYPRRRVPLTSACLFGFAVLGLLLHLRITGDRLVLTFIFYHYFRWIMNGFSEDRRKINVFSLRTEILLAHALSAIGFFVLVRYLPDSFLLPSFYSATGFLCWTFGHLLTSGRWHKTELPETRANFPNTVTGAP